MSNETDNKKWFFLLTITIVFSLIQLSQVIVASAVDQQTDINNGLISKDSLQIPFQSTVEETNTSTPTITNSPITTPTPEDSITNTPTRTPTTSISPSPSSTRKPSSTPTAPTPTFTLTPTLTSTPTTTLEPLPTFSQVFPFPSETATSTIGGIESVSIISTPDLPEEIQLPLRIQLIVVIIVLLWLFLAGLLIFFIRRIHT